MKQQHSPKMNKELPGRKELGGLISGRAFSELVNKDSRSFGKKYDRVIQKNGFVKLKKK